MWPCCEQYLRKLSCTRFINLVSILEAGQTNVPKWRCTQSTAAERLGSLTKNYSAWLQHFVWNVRSHSENAVRVLKRQFCPFTWFAERGKCEIFSGIFLTIHIVTFGCHILWIIKFCILGEKQTVYEEQVIMMTLWRFWTKIFQSNPDINWNFWVSGHWNILR
jgi:hypothetical protein